MYHSGTVLTCTNMVEALSKMQTRTLFVWLRLGLADSDCLRGSVYCPLVYLFRSGRVCGSVNCLRVQENASLEISGPPFRSLVRVTYVRTHFATFNLTILH